MKPVFALLIAAAFVAFAVPAAAGGVPVDLPRLTFPDSGEDSPGQGCANPGTLSGSACQGAGG